MTQRPLFVKQSTANNAITTIVSKDRGSGFHSVEELNEKLRRILRSAISPVTARRQINELVDRFSVVEPYHDRTLGSEHSVYYVLWSNSMTKSFTLKLVLVHYGKRAYSADITAVEFTVHALERLVQRGYTLNDAQIVGYLCDASTFYDAWASIDAKQSILPVPGVGIFVGSAKKNPTSQRTVLEMKTFISYGNERFDRLAKLLETDSLRSERITTDHPWVLEPYK